MFAFSTEKDGTGRHHDGEHKADVKLANLLKHNRLQNVVLIVARWFGGVHIGPDRFKNILECANEVLCESGLLQGVQFTRPVPTV